jgi:hypothetical protein
MYGTNLHDNVYCQCSSKVLFTGFTDYFRDHRILIYCIYQTTKHSSQLQMSRQYLYSSFNFVHDFSDDTLGKKLYFKKHAQLLLQQLKRLVNAILASQEQLFLSKGSETLASVMLYKK